MKKVLKSFVTLVVAIWIYAYFMRQQDKPPMLYVKWLPFDFDALTLPPFGVFIRADFKENEELKLHELVHWQQFQREGVFRFFYDYWKASKKGYDGNEYEIEARYRESDFCKENYTYCVRNGLAKTVSNAHFREGR